MAGRVAHGVHVHAEADLMGLPRPVDVLLQLIMALNHGEGLKDFAPENAVASHVDLGTEGVVGRDREVEPAELGARFGNPSGRWNEDVVRHQRQVVRSHRPAAILPDQGAYLGVLIGGDAVAGA